MSSSEENSSESEESCEESQQPTLPSKHVGRAETDSSSESDDEPETAPTANTSVNNKTIRASDSSEEELETSEHESKHVVKNTILAKAGHTSHAISSSDSESSSHSDEEDKKPVKTKQSSDEESLDSNSAASEVAVKKNNDVADSDNESSGSGESSSSEEGSSRSVNVKVERSSESSKPNSEDSGSDREVAVKKGLFDKTVSEEPPQDEYYSFSDENLIKYSSGIVNLENLSTNNDFWLVHCPKIIPEKELKGTLIDFASETRLKIGGHKLQTTIYPEKGTMGCVLPSHQQKQYYVVGLPVKGSVVFEESVKLPKPITPVIKSENDVEFPAKLKERHPLFGADFKERLRKFSELRHHLKKAKKRKSKDKKFSSNESLIAAAGLLKPKVEKETKLSTDMFPPQEPPRKDRKKSSLENSFVNGESSLRSSKKRKRDKSESDAISESLSESLISESTGKKRKVDKSETPANQSSLFNIIQNMKQEVESDFETPKKKKKSKHSK